MIDTGEPIIFVKDGHAYEVLVRKYGRPRTTRRARPDDLHKAIAASTKGAK